ncbi:crocetin glucoside glucosyltransferase-like [Tripterygium wilfordii]|uniref:Glycosyltransferase n=1 Tax=Tripterygium wilfordii TaxID=458696 RepID=A0A7J7CI18_TRIWF|nr:UDP-glucosyltransferase 29-like [Tripterygium wilfordii]KAF5733698.1 crocetin glucoside glucosyltransferase-like [Tripterygium wilfordii]
MEARQKTISVLMLPWLAHGHISPYLELAKKLTKRNFYIYFCSTPINLNSIKPKISQKYSLSIQLVELHLPSLEGLPPQYHSTKGLPPHLMTTLKKALDMSSTNFTKILEHLKPDLLIYDFLMPWAPEAAQRMNILAVNFMIVSTVAIAFVVHRVRNPSDEFPFLEIFLHDYEKLLLDKALEDGRDKDKAFNCLEQSCNIVLMKTFHELEGKYLDYLSVIFKKKMVPVGPLVQDPIQEIEDGSKEMIKWLDRKEQSSTVLVSFGSECFLTKEEREEVAYGLEISKVNFIWVIRFHEEDKTNLEESLPPKFIDRIGEKGIVVEGWAPQARILRHCSIAGFVSHCGWGSVMESMKLGVPIITMPMQLDQPLNARLVEDVGVGLQVKRNKSGRFEREEIAKVIRELVVEKNEDVKRKAKEMSEHLINKGEAEIDKVVNELVNLCGI